MHRLHRLENPYYIIPFEGGVALYVIINGFLTLNIDSAVLQNLHGLFGVLAFLAPLLQIAAGMLMLLGMGKSKANIEVAGLILVMTLFSIRAVALCLDGEISLQDINSIAIVLIIIVCSFVRINRILIVDKLLKMGHL